MAGYTEGYGEESRSMEVVLWIFMPLLNVNFIAGIFSNDAGYFLFSISTYFPMYVMDLFGIEPCNRLYVSIYIYIYIYIYIQHRRADAQKGRVTGVVYSASQRTG